jgi:phosphoglucomutase/phosphomannomutase
VEAFGDFGVAAKRDRWQGEPQPHLSLTDTSSRDVLIFQLAPVPQATGMRLTVRPSGTEPKVKMYFEVVGRPCALAHLATVKMEIRAICDGIEKAVMQYCYRILGIDFPERGFLLFWQLPLNVKMHYFEIEDDIAGLRGISDATERRRRLEDLLGFLGANPMEKVDAAFKARYRQGIREFLF